MKSEQDFSSIENQSQSNSKQKVLMKQGEITSEGMIMNNQLMQDMDLNEEQNLTEQDINQLKKIFAEFRDFKIEKQNKIELKGASKRTIFQTILLWKKRPIKNPNYTFTMYLQGPKIQKASLLELIQPYATIRIILDGQQLINKRAIHGMEGNTYYEGIDNEFMMITKINGDIIDYYEGDVKDRKENGNGVLYHYSNSKVVWQYVGQFVDGKRQGKGQQLNSKGVSYDGEFKNDFKHGKGEQVTKKKRKHPQSNQNPYVEKNRYIGHFEFGYRQGQGTQITPHGQYKGEWHQGMKHGKGTIKYKRGDSYEGDWVNNCQHGQGTYIQVIYIDDEEKFNKYCGEFKEGFYHGKGVMEYGNGDKYEGEWALGKKQGEGMYEWADGDYYDGHWEKDSAEGTGAACFGGVFYDGEFHLGQKHGLGQETDADGNTVKAIFQNGKIIKKLQINGQIIEQEDQER